MVNSRPKGNQYRTTLVCVDSYQNGVPQGRFFNPAQPQGAAFCSLLQFFAEVDHLLDQMRLPQSFTRSRSFDPPPPERKPAVQLDLYPQGRLATFSLRVLFRQNASWQGEIRWLDSGQTQYFRSALELAFLIDSALGGPGPNQINEIDEIASY